MKVLVSPLNSTSIEGLPPRSTTLKGKCFMSAWTSAVGELAADETLGIEDGVVGVHGDLVLGGIADETLGIREGDERRCRPVTHVVGNDIAL